MSGKLSSSMEDYLKTIHFLESSGRIVRVKDIARELEITMPSVTSALKNLEKLGFVNHSKYDIVVLTELGSEVAKRIYHRHNIIKSFLHNVLGLDEEIAERDACGMEHSMSPETLNGLVQFMEKRRKGS